MYFYKFLKSFLFIHFDRLYIEKDIDYTDFNGFKKRSCFLRLSEYNSNYIITLLELYSYTYVTINLIRSDSSLPDF